MNLTLQYTRPISDTIKCGRCDDKITRLDDFKYVRFNLGAIVKLNFHEDCFMVILMALNKFETIFIKEQRGDKTRLN